MNYYNLNIKISDNQKSDSSPAEEWLDCRRSAPIFFGHWSPEEIRSGSTPFQKKAANEAIEFIGLSLNPENARLITIDSGYVWIYKVIGPLMFDEKYSFKYEVTNELVIPKYYPIEIIKKLKVSEVPYILSAMKSSQAFARGTFTEINKNIITNKYIGNIAAIRSVLGETSGLSVNPFRCLSSVELETLVAKIFEAHGAFVPAHRGAVLKDVDVFADIKEANPDVRFEFNGSTKLCVQVKINTTDLADFRALEKFLNQEGHILITGEEVPNVQLANYLAPGKYKTSEWLRINIDKFPSVKNWLTRSLDWLPANAWLI